MRTGERGISPERLAQFRHELGLDQPVWKQFLDYVWQLLHGDFGISVVTNEKVLTEFFTLFPATLELSLFAMLFAVLLGMPAGIIAAREARQLFDQALMGALAHRLLDADLLVGPAAHHVRSASSGWTPVSGRIDLINYYFEPVTGFMPIDALLSGPAGRLLLGPAPSRSCRPSCSAPSRSPSSRA